jgi:hypothetical protein
MPDIEANLRKEIDIWLPRVEKEFHKIKTQRDPDFLKNIEAYIKDTHYFLEKKDPIKAFEAVIWAWAWLEIGKQKNIIK